jgi:phosphoglycolate phosphatase-like HAD superfamily hydrolase
MEGLVFLDFDGVICDSLLECLVSSWKAYHRLHRGAMPASVPLSLRSQFQALRPFVRSGEDFVLLQQLIDEEAPVRTQADFDARLQRCGPRTMERYRELFYAARSELLREQRGYWLALNRLYPHILPRLPAWLASPRLYILSTKRSPYIREILQHHGMSVDPARTLTCRARQKRTTILSVLDSRGAERGLFVDDQLDHLLPHPGEDGRIAGYLAAWGYVKASWLQESGSVPVLYPQQLSPLLQLWLRGSEQRGR